MLHVLPSLISFRALDPPPSLFVVYSRQRRCVVIRDYGSNLTPSVVHYAKTRRGNVSVTSEAEQFPDYPNVEVRPEGYALAIRAPKRMPVELWLKGWELDHMVIDGRRLRFKRERPRAYHCRFAGGDHFVEIAYRPENE